MHGLIVGGRSRGGGGGILIWDFAVYDGESIWLHANLAFMVVSSIG